MSYFPEFDKHGRYIESPCYGCDQPDCRFCPKELAFKKVSDYEP